jgi:putative endonuclease
MGNAKQVFGKYGEWLAAEFLVDSGMRLIARNWRCALGEIDIIAQDGDVTVFCEVKTRSGTTYGTPAEAVVRAKQLRLRKLAAEWMKTSHRHIDGVRFDVVAVLSPRRGSIRLQHIKGAF